MSIGAAFGPQGNTFAITTNATPATASAQIVSFASPVANQAAAQATGLTNMPPQMRVVNQGTAVVYMSVTNTARTAVAPAAGASSQEFPVQPGEDMVVTLSQGPLPNQNPALNMTMQINTISASASQVLNVTFGEGF